MIVKIYFKVVFDNRYYWWVDSTVPWRHKLSIPNMGYLFQNYRSGSLQRLSKQPNILPFHFVDHLKKIVRFYWLRWTLLFQDTVKSMENRLWNSLTSGWFSYCWKVLCRFLGVKITLILFFSIGLCMLQYWSTKKFFLIFQLLWCFLDLIPTGRTVGSWWLLIKGELPFFGGEAMLCWMVHIQ